MGHRLTRIYTRTGDDGTTGLASGARVAKDSLRVEAIGAVDELNSVLGAVLAQNIEEDMRTCLTDVQHRLFDLGGELAVPDHVVMRDAHVTRLEQAIDAFNETLPPLKDFILPGGTMAAALTHVARATCRRAERSVVALSRVETVPPVLLSYLNRLSDLLFVVARRLNQAAGVNDVLWKADRTSE